MHKKQASLVPLTYEYTLGSEQEEGVATPPHNLPRASQSPSSVCARKPGARSKTPDPDENPCNCTTTAIPSRSVSGALPLQSPRIQSPSLINGGGGGHSGSSSNKAPPVDDVALAVDGHQATVSLTSNELLIYYTGGSGCCMPGVSLESIPFSEVLSAQSLPPVTAKWLWHPFAERTYRFSVFTFARSPRSPTSWHPRYLTFSTPVERIALHWTATINAAAASQRRRPRHLLVLVNPYGGKQRGPQLYTNVVAPVFEKAGIKTTVCTTQFGGHARDLLLDLPTRDLMALDGIVAVGGDGLFHEIINALIQMRQSSRGSPSRQGENFNGRGFEGEGSIEEVDSGPGKGSVSATASKGVQGEEMKNIKNKRGAGEDVQRSLAAASIRVGHIPAGSTDAVACTLNGTRSAFSAAMRIALGDGSPLDVLRIDAVDGTTRFATCMASYGFMGDLMAESELYRWMGPLRYELIGAKMLAANRSYSAKISYLRAEQTMPGSFSRVCSSKCDVCGRGGGGRLGHGHSGGGVQQLSPASSSSATPIFPRPSLNHRSEDWVTVEGEFAGIMLVIMPCRSDKSANGVARYGHLSDGNIHLVMVKRCSRLQYLRFLMKLSSTGLEAGKLGGYVEVVPAVAVKIVPTQGTAESVWNVDGELLRCGGISAQTHRGAIEVFSRGVECGSEWE